MIIFSHSNPEWGVRGVGNVLMHIICETPWLRAHRAKLGWLSVVCNICVCDVVGAKNFSLQKDEGETTAWRFVLILARDGNFFEWGRCNSNVL
jgi:hypothetical protein